MEFEFRKEWFLSAYEGSPLPFKSIKEKEYEKIFSEINTSFFSQIFHHVVNAVLVKDFYNLSRLFGRIDYLKYLHQFQSYSELKNDPDDQSFNISKIQDGVQQITIGNVKNNFDNIEILDVYNHFKKGLVDKKHLSENELIEYLKFSFDKMEIPKTLFEVKNVHTKQKIIKVFFHYYKDISGKPHGKQKEYAALLGDYFEGFVTENVRTNFNK
jgi:hypothetical protein